MTDRLENFRAGYALLQERVRVALRVQLGDVHRLRAQRDEVLGFLNAADQVRPGSSQSRRCPDPVPSTAMPFPGPSS